MTRALVTQMLEAMEPVSAYGLPGTKDVQQTKLQDAIKAAKEYLATEPKPTLKEALTQQGIKLRTEFEPKQRDHIEDSLGMVGERAELIVMLRNRHLTGQTQMAMLKAADLLEADADLRMQLARRTVERNMAISMLVADAQQAKRVPMTDDEIDEIGVDYSGNFQVLRDFARAIEAHHGITPADKPTDWSAA